MTYRGLCTDILDATAQYLNFTWECHVWIVFLHLLPTKPNGPCINTCFQVTSKDPYRTALKTSVCIPKSTDRAGTLGVPAYLSLEASTTVSQSPKNPVSSCLFIQDHINQESCSLRSSTQVQDWEETQKFISRKKPPCSLLRPKPVVDSDSYFYFSVQHKKLSKIHLSTSATTCVFCLEQIVPFSLLYKEFLVQQRSRVNAS